MVMISPQTYTSSDQILVVEDDASSFIAAILRLAGYEVTHIQSGTLALTQILDCPPSLIISKVITIPTTSKAFSEYIRETPQIPYIPILLIASPHSEDIVQCLDAGADDFLRFPVETDELLARVRSLLRLKNNFDERERITQIREDFLSRLTHDLRTPLVAADRMFDRLCQGKYGPMSLEATEILQSMQENNQELMNLTNTLLAVYRYESGIKSLSFTDFDLKALIQSVISELQPLAKEEDLQLKFEGSSHHSGFNQTFMIEGVKLELRTAFINLLGNALKFTDQGWIQTAILTNGDEYQIRIQDTGPGIPPQDLPRVFDRFYQGQHHRSGSGLGLNLVWQIVVAHQGRIEATSQLGEGTCFTLWLPRFQNRPITSTKS